MVHCSYNGTGTDPVIFLGSYSTSVVFSYMMPVPLHSIVTVAFSGASPVHSNVTWNNILLIRIINKRLSTGILKETVALVSLNVIISEAPSFTDLGTK